MAPKQPPEEQMKKALTRAEAELQKAEAVAIDSLYAIQYKVSARLGLDHQSVLDDDPRTKNDPEYWAALELFGSVRDLHRDVKEILKRMSR